MLLGRILKGLNSVQERIEQDDACPECAEANGKIYEFGNEPDWHPNCRGCLLPVIQ